MIRRLGHSVFIILGLMALLFFSINVLGDPIALLVDDEASQGSGRRAATALWVRPAFVREIR